MDKKAGNFQRFQQTDDEFNSTEEDRYASKSNANEEDLSADQNMVVISFNENKNNSNQRNDYNNEGIELQAKNGAKDLAANLDPNAFVIFVKTLDNKIKEIDIKPLLDSNATIKQLKQIAFPQESLPSSNKSIRMIYQGKLLKDEQSLKEFNINKGQYIHAVINDIETQEGVAPNSSNQENSLEPNANNQIVSLQDDPQVQMVIRQFLQEELMRPRQIRETSELQSEFRRGMFPDPYMREGSKLEFIAGALFGYVFFMFAILMMLCMRCSRRGRAGIVLGFTLRILFNVFILLQRGVDPVYGNGDQSQQDSSAKNATFLR